MESELIVKAHLQHAIENGRSICLRGSDKINISYVHGVSHQRNSSYRKPVHAFLMRGFVIRFNLAHSKCLPTKIVSLKT